MRYEARARAERAQAQADKVKTEAERKVTNVKKDIARFGALSNHPNGDQAAYLKSKQIDHNQDIFRFGTDKRGDFTAIKLFDVKSLANPQVRWLPVGIQRFYSKAIEWHDDSRLYSLVKGLEGKGASSHQSGQSKIIVAESDLIEQHGTKKLFTWGFKKTGACSVIGDIPQGYVDN